MNDERCCDCVHFDDEAYVKFEGNPDHTGLCKRNAPRVMKDDADRWPKVKESDWCSKFCWEQVTDSDSCLPKISESLEKIVEMLSILTTPTIIVTDEKQDGLKNDQPAV